MSEQSGTDAADTGQTTSTPATPSTGADKNGPAGADTGSSAAAPSSTPKKPETREERKARLAEASRVMREAKAAKAKGDPPASAAPTEAAPTTDASSSAPVTPGPGDKKPLDAWAKVAEAQRKHELAKQELARAREAFTAEGEARKAELELSKRYSPLEQLIKEKKHAEIMQLVYGDQWREAWLDMTQHMAPEPPKPLSQADAERIAAEKFAALTKEAQEKEASERRTRVEHGLNTYIGRVRELAEAAKAKYPSVAARGSLENRERIKKILEEEHPKSGILDPQVLLDRLESEDTAFFRQALPYAGQAANPADAASGPAKTITPALRQGGLPPASSPGSLTVDQDREARKARLKATSEQQRQQQ